MIDCHIIISHDTPREWVAQCLDSVHAAAECAGYPVHVHIADGVPGHIGQARAAGYALGSQSYVTCVDDDDYVLPHAFAQMAEALRAGVSTVCTPELIDRNGWDRRERGQIRHHLIAYRRDQLIDHTQWPCCGDVAQIAAIPGDAIDLPGSAYMHRIYPDSKARMLRRSHVHELERAGA